MEGRYSASIFSIGLRLLLTQTLLTGCQASPAKQRIPQFDGHRAYNHLLKQCEFGPRNPGSTGHQKCRDFLVSTLKTFTDQVSTQTFTMRFGQPPENATATNIIARFNPDTPTRILLCAHWDTRPWADNDPNPQNHDKPIIGANDGASGVAVLLEMARILQNHPPRIGVDIVLFDGEDAGESGESLGWIQGSTHFAQNLKGDYRPQYGILLDMIGDRDLAIYKEANSWHYARPVVELVWKQALQLNLKAFKPNVGYAILDDHIPLLRQGISCIDIIDFDYPYWHTQEDTPDKCSAESLEAIGKLLVQLIYSPARQ